MNIPASDLAWLMGSGLVDPGVDLGRVSLHTAGLPAMWVRFRGRSAMTIGNHIWFSAPEKQRSRALLVHELVHVSQYRQMTVPGFLLRYLLHLARAGFKYSRKLPLEAPAYARQAAAKARLDAEAAAGDSAPAAAAH